MQGVCGARHMGAAALWLPPADTARCIYLWAQRHFRLLHSAQVLRAEVKHLWALWHRRQLKERGSVLKKRGRVACMGAERQRIAEETRKCGVYGRREAAPAAGPCSPHATPTPTHRRTLRPLVAWLPAWAPCAARTSRCWGGAALRRGTTRPRWWQRRAGARGRPARPSLAPASARRTSTRGPTTPREHARCSSCRWVWISGGMGV